MRGVDLFDQRMNTLIGHGRRQNRLHRKLTFYYVTAAIANASAVYKRYGPTLRKGYTSIDFALDVEECLLGSVENEVAEERSVGTPVHCVEWCSDRRGPCAMCGSRVSSQCKLCEVYLCCNKNRNCWNEGHCK